MNKTRQLRCSHYSARAHAVTGLFTVVLTCSAVLPWQSAAAADSTKVEFDSSSYAEEQETARPDTFKVTPSQTAARSSIRHVRLNGFLEEAYDNNILNYSDHDRALYDSGTATPGRFAINQIDDYITDLGLRATYETGRRRNQWRVRGKFDATFFANNAYRKYVQWGLEVRRTVRKSYLEASISWLPKYNLRNLYWRPMVGRPLGVRYAPADFHRLAYALEFGTDLSRRVDLRATLAYGKSNYVYPFDERDNHTLAESARLGYTVSRRVSVHGGFGFAQSRAGGRDSVNAIVKDVSYNATDAEFGVRCKCDRKGKWIAAGGIDYQHQKFLSDKPLDTSHYHRIDDDYQFDLSLSYRLTPNLQPEINYAYRTTKSTVVASGADFGAYSAYHIGFQMTTYF